MPLTREHQRLQDSIERRADWKNWGPYLSERAWGTVREDYSPYGSAWEYFDHDQSRSRAYRWNEDGLGGICNRFQNICLGVGLWNGNDPILKERLFGVTGNEGNHGEDVKEYYFYLDSTPTHSYMKMLYKYPHAAYPYADLVERNRTASRFEPEYELIDALRKEFMDHRYFDVFIEYAKADEEDVLCRITAINRGPDAATIHLLPQLWFRNAWSWGYNRPREVFEGQNGGIAYTNHRHLGRRWWHITDQYGEDDPTLLFTENETNYKRLYGNENASPYVKDGFHDAVVQGRMECVNPDRIGSKVAGHFERELAPGESYSVWTRFANYHLEKPFEDFEAVFASRIKDADEFWNDVQPPTLTDDERLVHRQALAGLLWSKQFYHYSVELWMDGDPAMPPPPESRRGGRNGDWNHLYNLDVISMPDKWEYPWFAAWDLAFHCVPLVLVDPEWAKRQLVLLLREWYMHPNGQIPAYEWNFGDVNPPVHAWAALQVYKLDRSRSGVADTEFLERVFHKLLLNFTWWVNRKDQGNNNIFQGGFLGLDNIGVFDRSKPLPTGGHLEQADGTAWMGLYCLNMLEIALELARTKPAYEDVATKFFEHFVYIAHAITHMGGIKNGLWEDPDGFFYDLLNTPQGELIPLKVRSFVGLIPLFATLTLDADLLKSLPRFKARMEWFIKYRPGLVEDIHSLIECGMSDCRLLSVVDRDKLNRVLQTMLDENEFLSDYGLRSLSKVHERKPYRFEADGEEHAVSYEPAESTTGLFGGNSNWRGPIWFPVNYLMIQALRTYHEYYGETMTVEFPTGSDFHVTLDIVADELSRRMTRIFLSDEEKGGRRPVFGDEPVFQNDPNWRDHPLFYEYFHGDTGSGIGASHQTGWTALVATLLQEIGLRQRG